MSGQQAVYTFKLAVDGHLEAHDVSGSAAAEATVYSNGVRVPATVTRFDAGGGVVQTAQSPVWAVATYGYGGAAQWDVAAIVTFAVPVVLGQSFDLGVYGLAYAGMRSSGNVSEISSSQSDFANTLR